ncbi:hypothetical protein [Pseudomonas sp. PLMAX]|uniref:hypothetical protein n=1 Tax=Pseudomonas sp. PLMAX TaxID=2201998 RepID=UPI0038B97435
MALVRDKFDIVGCSQVVIKINELSMDFSFDKQQRAFFHQLGQELWFYLDQVSALEFEKGANVLKAASEDLQVVIDSLNGEIQKLENIAVTLKTVDSLIVNLSKFLAIVTAVV